jgi:hypothetical protein
LNDYGRNESHISYEQIDQATQLNFDETNGTRKTMQRISKTFRLTLAACGPDERFSKKLWTTLT